MEASLFTGGAVSRITPTNGITPTNETTPTNQEPTVESYIVGVDTGRNWNPT